MRLCPTFGTTFLDGKLSTKLSLFDEHPTLPSELALVLSSSNSLFFGTTVALCTGWPPVLSDGWRPPVLSDFDSSVCSAETGIHFDHPSDFRILSTC